MEIDEKLQNIEKQTEIEFIPDEDWKKSSRNIKLCIINNNQNF